MRKLLICSIILIACNTLAAQTQDAMLWKVSGKDLKKPTYLFGTIHLYCDYQSIITPSLMSAMQSSDVVAMEVDLGDTNVIREMMLSVSRTSPRNVKNLLKPKEYRLVDSVFTALTGKPLQEFDSKSPIMVMSHLVASKPVTGCDQPLPIDLIIASLASQSGKKTYGLESYSFQESVLNAIPDSLQVKWLVDFCRDVPGSIADVQLMMDAYRSQKSDSMLQVMLEVSPEMELLEDMLLIQRNIRWVEFLENNMAAQAYFMAVGAGHLGGKDGLVSLLRKAGYTVTPVQ